MRKSCLAGIITLLLMSALLSLAACGGKPASDSGAPTEKDPSYIPTEATLYGNAPEQEAYRQLCESARYKSLGKGEWKSVELPSLSELLLALNAGKVDWMYVPLQTARYIKRQNPQLTVLADGSFEYCYFMFTKEDDRALCQEIDGVIGEMKEDGSLDALSEQYLYGQIDKFAPIQMPRFEGAETIKIGLSGDFPPVDQLAADGAPTGFSTALCAAIGQQLEKNIELVTFTAEARLAALESGTVDVLYLQQGYGSSATATSADGFCATRAYAQDYGAALTVKYPCKDILKRFGILDLSGQ